MDILPLFCDIDDFCLLFAPHWQARLLDTRQRQRASTLCLSEVMTIIVLFHASSYRDFQLTITLDKLPKGHIICASKGSDHVVRVFRRL